MKTKNLIIICCGIFFAQIGYTQTSGCISSNSTVTINRGDVEDVPPKDPPVNPPPSDPNFDQERIIFWVHGLGGNANSWTKAANATSNGTLNHPDFPARKAFCIRPTYTEFEMRDAAIDLQNQMVTQGLPINQILDSDPSDNFIIAHSQGGLVSRMVEKLYVDGDIPEDQRMFGGIVTYGTPHQGARILNNTEPNGPDMASKFAIDACEELGIGPLLEKSEKNLFLDLITTRNMVEEVLSTTCTLAGNIVPIIFSDFTSGITEDYKVGSSTITSMNQSSSNIPKVALYGVENDSDGGLVWRIMSSLRPQEPNNFQAFDANADNSVAGSVNTHLTDYRAKVNNYQGVMDGLRNRYQMPCSPARWIFDPITCGLYDGQYWESKAIRDAYNRGINWLNSANENYKFVIGSSWVQTSTYYICGCDNYTFQTQDRNQCASAGCDVVGVNIITNVTREESDGVVVVSSAKNYPGADAVVKLNNSNHQQMRNDSNTKISLSNLFRGDLGRFFIVETR